MTNPILTSDLAAIHADLGTKTAKFRDGVVLITGCAGFLGYYFINYFVRYGQELGVKQVIGLDTFLLDRPRWLDQLVTEFPQLLTLQKFDIAKDDLATVPLVDQTTYVIHMASIASPTFYRQYPLETIDANIWGLRQLLDRYRDSAQLKGLLFFSSSEIYGDPDAAHIPTAEDYRGNVSCLGPRACYDESKRFGETLCQIFAETHKMPIRIARPFNNYGPGMRLGDKRLPADMASCIMENRDIVIHSDGTPTRTFCYISDAVTGYLLCLLHNEFDAFNIGIAHPEISVREFAAINARAGAEIMGYRGQVRFEASQDAAYLSHNPQRRCPVIRKAQQELGYAPKVLVEDGVRRYLQFLHYEQQQRASA